MEDDPNGRQPQWKTTSMEDGGPQLNRTSMEDSLYGRKPQRKTTLMEDNLNGRKPQWRMTSMGEDLKEALQEDDINLFS